MHMSDALLTPVVGGTMLAGGSGMIGYSIRKLKSDFLEEKIPLMGVMGAFLFAAQMINFAIPGTGSSGHIGGGMLLAIILGPAAGFLTLSVVLLIQALFFADGGLLAFGCNVINLGFFTCYVAYPLIYKPIVAKIKSNKGMMIGALAASIVGLQLGAFGVVVETLLSGRSELPFGTFVLFMQPIHLAIGVVEGVVTGVIVIYIANHSKDLLYKGETGRLRNKFLLITILVAALVTGGILSAFASGSPDGLEWAIENTTGSEALDHRSSFTAWIEDFQGNFALMPDYAFRDSESGGSLAGVGGSLLVLAITGVGALGIRRMRRLRTDND